MKKLTVLDYTLCSLESRENPLLFREKTAISAMPDSCGADVIVLPPLKKLREDTVIYKTIAGLVKKAAVGAECSSEESLEQAYEAIFWKPGALLSGLKAASTARRSTGTSSRSSAPPPGRKELRANRRRCQQPAAGRRVRQDAQGPRHRLRS